MSVRLTWRNEWSLGIGVLDEDHRSLVETLIDISLRYCPQATPPVAMPPAARSAAPSTGTSAVATGLAAALNTFRDKARCHFRREEAFMHAIDYERCEEHEAAHAALLAGLDAMVHGCLERSDRVFDEIGQAQLRDWLLGHILVRDRELVRVYLALCGLEDSGGWLN
jgi:hemerythrin